MGDALPIAASFSLRSGEDQHFAWLQAVTREALDKIAPLIGPGSSEGLQRGLARLTVAQNGLEALLGERERAATQTDNGWRRLVTLLATGTGAATALGIMEQAQALSAQAGGQDDAFFSSARAWLLSSLRQNPQVRIEERLASALERKEIAPAAYLRHLEEIYQRLPRERMDEDRLALETEFWHFKSSFKALADHPEAFAVAAPCLIDKMSKTLTLAALADRAGDALAHGDGMPLLIARAYYAAHFERPPVRACLARDPLTAALTGPFIR